MVTTENQCRQTLRDVPPEHNSTTTNSREAILYAIDQPVAPYSLGKGHTFGNIDIRHRASVHLGDKYLQQVTVHTNQVDKPDHKELASKLEAQTQTIDAVRTSLIPIAQESRDTWATVTNLAKTAAKQALTLKSFQKKIACTPSNANVESIAFLDALDRCFRLPFNWFNNWQASAALSHTIFQLYSFLSDVPRLLEAHL